MTDAAFDTLETMRDLEAAGVERAHAEAIAGAVRKAAGAGHEELATKTDIASLGTKIANLRADVYRALWMQAGAIVAAVVALVKLLP